MDKAEYRSKLEEINSLAEAGQFREAAVVADEVDWKHVKSARTLCMIGEIYEADRRYVDSARVLRFAYKRSASSKTVLYRLAELDIRNGEYDEAKRFINEFEQISPNDTSRYILQYKLLRATHAPLDDQIAMLKEYKDHEYTERWAYELAKLYKKNGQKEKCIEECDDMILWFSEGKFVTKAMELKMSLTTLTPSQQAAYDNRHLVDEKALKESEETEARELSGLESVEKKILSADEEDGEENPPVKQDEETGTRPEQAAGAEPVRGEGEEKASEETGENDETGEAGPAPEEAADAPAKEKKTLGSVAGGLQKKLSHSIRAVFAGMRLSDEEDEDEDVKIAPDLSRREVAPIQDSGEVSIDHISEPAAENAAGAGTEETAADDFREVSVTIPSAAAAAGAEVEAEEVPAAFASGGKTGDSAAMAAAAGGLMAAAGAAGAALTAEEGSREAAAGASEESSAAADKAVAEAAEEKREAAAEAEAPEEEKKKSGGGFTAAAAGGLLAAAGGLVAAVGAAAASSAKEEKSEAAEEVKEPAGEAAEKKGEEGRGSAAGGGLMAAVGAAVAALVAGSSSEEKKKAGADGEAAVPAKGAAEENGNTPAEADGVDLDRLFAETGDALAGEVASGGYVMADTLESDREQAEEEALRARKRTAEESLPAAEEPVSKKDPSEDLIARETDESLGLTRELHLRDAIEEELMRRNAAGQPDAAGSERTPIMRPEEAARMAVAKAYGKPYDPDSVPDDELPDEPLKELPEGEGVSDEELLAIYGAGAAAQAGLAGADGELPPVPEEESREMADGAPDGGMSIIDSIMGEPGVFTAIPVEGRALTEPEKKALSYFASIPGIDYQVTSALADIHNNSGDKTSKSGNIVIMGRQGSGKTRLAEGIILIACMDLGIKAAKVGRLVAENFNAKDPAEVVSKMAGGFLIIEAAGALSDEAIDKLNRAMEFRTDDMIVILEDEKSDMKQLLDRHPEFAGKFTSRITVPVFTNDELVTFARTYAREEGYKFDEMATLALYTMIGDNQRDTEPMTVGKVRQLVDKAIERNSRKLFGKITDKEDGRIVLMEKDFNF